jgi:arylsulfatase A
MLGGVSGAAPAAGNPHPPNILLILIDDLGWKDIGCAGSTYYETPHIDDLASEGMRFLNAYSAAPVCSPSRGAVYTGKNPARTQFTAVWSGPAGPDDRLYDQSKYRGENDQFLEARSRRALPKKEVLLSEPLARSGYRTGFFGKWHCGECPDYYPDDRGFQTAKGYRTRKVGTSKSGHWMKSFRQYGANMEGADKDAYVADVLTGQCIDFIKAGKDRPWFAVLSHYLVHTPIDPKPDKMARYRKKPTTDQGNPAYASMVESVDESVGRVMQALETLGLEQDTLVIFTSDNGGLTLNSITSNYPLMGGKSFPFEAGMKVPFIAKWPGKVQPGVTEQRVVGMDIYPTILSAAGLALRPEQHVDGVDLTPLLTQRAKLDGRSIVFHYPHYTHATGPFSSIIEENWKLIRFYNDERGAYLLFNLAADPNEQSDLAAAHPERVNALAERLDRSLKEMKAEMPTENPGFKPSRGGKRFNLESTRSLAEKERRRFESRLKAVSDGSPQ